MSKKKSPKQKCPLTVVDKIRGGHEVYLSKHIWQAEAACDCDLEYPLNDEFDLPKKFRGKNSRTKAIRYANEVSDKMDQMAEESGGPKLICKKVDIS